MVRNCYQKPVGFEKLRGDWDKKTLGERIIAELDAIKSLQTDGSTGQR